LDGQDIAMIDRSQAIRIAEVYVGGLSPNLTPGDILVVNDQNTLEKPYGWIFFHTSKRWLETGDITFAVAGNAPFLVTRDTGELHVFGTARPVDWYIDEYERGAKAP